MKHVLFPLSELPTGKCRGVMVGNTPVVVAHAPDGQVHALRDRCSHRGAKLSYSPVEPILTGDDVGQHVVSDEYMVRCSRHGFEFRLQDGRCPADPKRVRVRVYPVTVEDGMVVVET